MMPQTLLAFIGASGRSVKIVCRGEIFGGGLPTKEEDIKRFHLNLYEKARMVYNAWSMNTTSRKPTIDEIVKLPAT